MSELRFDRLVRVAGGSSRRLALQSALGAATVAVAGLLSINESNAKNKNKRKKRKRKKCPACQEVECPTCQGYANGDSCFTTAECCGTETNLACAKKKGMGFGTVCCGTGGASCSADEDCCDGFICNLNLGRCFTV